MKCNCCGKEISDDAKFCNSCGTPVVQENGKINLSKQPENIDNNVNINNNPVDNINTTGTNNSLSPKYVDFGEAISLYFRNYINFSGRSTRSEYWFAILFNVIVGFVLNLLGEKMEFVSNIWSLATFLPSLAICFRRFHDAGKKVTAVIVMYAVSVLYVILLVATFGSAILAGVGGSRSLAHATGGMFILVAIISLALLAVAIYNIVILCQPSVPTENKYGRPPVK